MTMLSVVYGIRGTNWQAVLKEAEGIIEDVRGFVRKLEGCDVEAVLIRFDSKYYLVLSAYKKCFEYHGFTDLITGFEAHPAIILLKPHEVVWEAGVRAEVLSEWWLV